jgi:hypothetical protein
VLACHVAATHAHRSHDVAAQIQRLKDCVSVLFIFHRKPIKDPEFVDNVRRWTERLVGVLFVSSLKSNLLYAEWPLKIGYID